MKLSLNAQATILLTSYFSRPNKGDAKPLTNTEWGKLASWLIEKKSTPAAFIEKDAKTLLDGWEDAKITSERIVELLSRGHSFALAMEKWERAGLWVLTRSDTAYPKRLKSRLKMQAPPVLFGCGNQDLLNSGGLAVVGSRKAMPDDLSFTQYIGRNAAQNGVMIISGAAKGIDETSMLASVESGGFAIGVMADSLLRASSSAKWRKGLMEQRAVLISSFYPEAGFNVGNAMARNKYIYCLSDSALVVHSGKTGGTVSGAKENLKKQWVPLWVKPTDDTEAANAELVELGGRYCGLDSDSVDVISFFHSPDSSKTLAIGSDVVVDKRGDKLVEESGLCSPSKDHPESTVVEQTDLFSLDDEKRSEEDVFNSEESIVKQTISPKSALSNDTESESDVFYRLFLNEVSNLTEHAVSETYLLENLNLHKSQLKDWLKNAVEDEIIQKLSRPVRYQWKKNN
ncbi:MAG: DNA-processing protein DprA [Bacteroidales bacterium]|jgi:predicted Rossmann fold nucleotide-binding protein DprA/Smf involved in DNA uptake|nr:DNA-processing protein DprA [Bacteroidales bacterium]